MVGTYFVNPDALEPATAARSYDELVREAESLGPTGILVVWGREAEQIKREISLAYTWRGKRVFIPPCRCDRQTDSD